MTYSSTNHSYKDDDLKIELPSADFSSGSNEVNVCLQLFKEVLELNCENTCIFHEIIQLLHRLWRMPGKGTFDAIA
jgi:hypothetical protein